MARTGRPKKTIDYETAEKLASIMCTRQEIANYLNLSLSKLERDEEFNRIYKKAKDVGKCSLRREQYKKAMSGNTTMLIWLGKQYLGQTDKQEVETKYDFEDITPLHQALSKGQKCKK